MIVLLCSVLMIVHLDDTQAGIKQYQQVQQKLITIEKNTDNQLIQISKVLVARRAQEGTKENVTAKPVHRKRVSSISTLPLPKITCSYCTPKDRGECCSSTLGTNTNTNKGK